MRADASTYTTFGSFNLALPMGSYTMVVLGYGLNDGEPAITLSSPTEATFGEYPARETFVATQAVSITSTTVVEISATLSRIVSKLKVHSTDGCTANAVNVRTTFSAGGKAFNPTTGLATTNTGFSNVLPIQSFLGNSTNSISYLFLDTDEQSMTVTIDVLDGNGESISHKVVGIRAIKAYADSKGVSIVELSDEEKQQFMIPNPRYRKPRRHSIAAMF